MTKSILITGCSSGIGYDAAITLQKRGYDVFATARNVEDISRLQDEGLNALQLDVTDSASINDAVKQILDKTHGRLDALFNNAGYGQPAAVEDLTKESLRQQFETNVFGLIELTQKFIPVMREQGGGRIVLNSSILGRMTIPFFGAYAASKYAVEAFADAMRMELHSANIQVSLIEPGPITTKFRENAEKNFTKHIPAEKSEHIPRYFKMQQGQTRSRKINNFFSKGPDAVVNKLIHALESPRPRTRYLIGPVAKTTARMKQILPTRLMDAILRKS